MLKFIRYTFLFLIVFLFCSWGFHAHRTINRHAVYLLPPEMNSFFLDHIKEIEERSVLPDKRRYVDSTESCKHYIDIDLYGENPFDSVPSFWFDAKEKFTEDTLKERGILPWVIYWEYKDLVHAMDSGTVEDGMTIPSADAVAVRYTRHSKRGFIDGGAIIHEQTKHTSTALSLKLTS